MQGSRELGTLGPGRKHFSQNLCYLGLGGTAEQWSIIPEKPRERMELDGVPSLVPLTDWDFYPQPLLRAWNSSKKLLFPFEEKQAGQAGWDRSRVRGRGSILLWLPIAALSSFKVQASQGLGPAFAEPRHGPEKVA